MGKKCSCGASANNTYKGKPVCNSCLYTKTRGGVLNTSTARVRYGDKKKGWW